MSICHKFWEKSSLNCVSAVFFPCELRSSWSAFQMHSLQSLFANRIRWRRWLAICHMLSHILYLRRRICDRLSWLWEILAALPSHRAVCLHFWNWDQTNVHSSLRECLFDAYEFPYSVNKRCNFVDPFNCCLRTFCRICYVVLRISAGCGSWTASGPSMRFDISLTTQQYRIPYWQQMSNSRRWIMSIARPVYLTILLVHRSIFADRAVPVVGLAWTARYYYLELHGLRFSNLSTSSNCLRHQTRARLETVTCSSSFIDYWIIIRRSCYL